MIPIGDDNRDRTLTPYVNYVLIALNLLVFVLFQGMGNNLEFTYAFSTVPQEIITGEDVVTQSEQVRDPSTGQVYVLPGLQPTPISVYITLLTSMFMHGGWAHILGNMLYLWIFGDNLEDRLGHGRYLIFYLLVGLLASLAHVFASVLIGDNLLIPSLGASGAIAGVLGGYLLLFPGRRVTVILIRVVTQVRAIFAVGVWFLLQLVGGLGVLGGGNDGVAYAAHIGGFIAGLALVKLFDNGSTPQTRSW
ncbi:MAG: rhomboid family intramembrane serine protease [Ardenticatenaceae bacterium]|nr:rhomboid family intramembrane serine protease [Ardenticatenaceae bacterium]